MKGTTSSLGSFFFAIPALLWQALFLLLPLAIVVRQSFSSADISVFTFEKYLLLFDPIYLKVIARSVFLALTTAFTCLLIGYPVAYFIAFRSDRWRGLFLFLVMLPLWTSLLVQIYAWFFLLERDGIITQFFLKLGFDLSVGSIANSTFAIALVMTYCYLPFMVMPLYTALDSIEEQIAEASADLGARPWHTFFRVILPLSLPGIRAGLLLVLVPAFGEFSIPSLLGGGRYLYVGSLISYLALVVRDTGLSAAFTCLSGAVLLSVVYILYRGIRYIENLWGGGQHS